MKNTRFQFYILLFGIAVSLIKFFVYFHSMSNAILADALESMVNIIAGGFTLFSLYLASKPADVLHPYGHGKVEFLAAGFEGSMLLGVGVYSIFKVIQSYYIPHNLDIDSIDLAIILLLGIFNYGLGVWSHKKGEISNSPALKGSAVHLKSDGYISFGIILGLLFVYLFHWKWVDNAVAIIVSLALIYNGYKVIKDSIEGILDKADTNILEEVVQYLGKNRKANWIDIHNLRIIKYGSNFHLDAHMTLPWYFTNRQVHDEMKEVHSLINTHFNKEVEIFIHPDPCETYCCQVCTIDCSERQSPFLKKEEWTLDNVLKNEKHKILK